MSECERNLLQAPTVQIELQLIQPIDVAAGLGTLEIPGMHRQL